MAIEKETVDLHIGTCDWCEDVAQIHHSNNSIFHLSHTFLGTTVKQPWCCVEEMHIFKAFPSNSIRYKPVNFHVTHSSFQVYIANCINIYYYTSTAISTQSHSR